MKVSFSLATRYTNALIALLVSNEKLEDLDKYIEGIKKINAKIEEDDVLKDIVFSPLLPKSYISESLIKVSELNDEIFEKFIYAVVQKKRQSLLKAIEIILERYSYELKKLIEVDVMLSDKISEELLENIKNVLKKKTGRNISLKEIINEDLIGGLQLIIDDKLFDYSVKGYLESIKRLYASSRG